MRFTISKAYMTLNNPGTALQIANQLVRSGTASDSALKFRQSLLQGNGSLNALKLPENVVATKTVKELPFEKKCHCA